jgi:catechol 2,3-dioxygenase-like lactoylglutathione lyase family enzyme
MSMTAHIPTVTYVVRDYDEAIFWFTRCLGFGVKEDNKLSADKRWVVVGPPGGIGCNFLLAQASTPEQQAAIGKAAGGRVAFFLNTTDFAAAHAHMSAAGVKFMETPRNEAYGQVAVFEDLYGNRWDLIQPA